MTIAARCVALATRCTSYTETQLLVDPERLRDINRQDAKSAKRAPRFLWGMDDVLDAALKYCDAEVDE